MQTPSFQNHSKSLAPFFFGPFLVKVQNGGKPLISGSFGQVIRFCFEGEAGLVKRTHRAGNPLRYRHRPRRPSFTRRGAGRAARRASVQVDTWTECGTSQGSLGCRHLESRGFTTSGGRSSREAHLVAFLCLGESNALLPDQLFSTLWGEV